MCPLKKSRTNTEVYEALNPRPTPNEVESLLKSCPPLRGLDFVPPCFVVMTKNRLTPQVICETKKRIKNLRMDDECKERALRNVELLHSYGSSHHKGADVVFQAYRGIFQDSLNLALMTPLREKILRGKFDLIDRKECQALVKPVEKAMENMAPHLSTFQRALSGLFRDIPYILLVVILDRIITDSNAEKMSFWSSLSEEAIRALACSAQSRSNIRRQLNSKEIVQIISMYTDCLAIVKDSAESIVNLTLPKIDALPVPDVPNDFHDGKWTESVLGRLEKFEKVIEKGTDVDEEAKLVRFQTEKDEDARSAYPSFQSEVINTFTPS